jgi:DNA-binding LacI/PurR family transcriptional regulator
VVRELGLPAIVIGSPQGAGSLPAVWQNDTAAMLTVVRYLAGLGVGLGAGVGAGPPTAIVYDNDLMALAGLAVAKSLGTARDHADHDRTQRPGRKTIWTRTFPDPAGASVGRG